MDGRGEEAKRTAGMSSANALKKSYGEYQQYLQQSSRRVVVTCCDMCGGKVSKDEEVSLECGHIFHSECAKEAMEIQVEKNSFPVMCPVNDCEQEPSMLLLSLLLTRTHFQACLYFEHSLCPKINQNQCYNCGQRFLSDSEVDFHACIKCKQITCLRCQQQYHPSRSCQSSGEQSSHKHKQTANFKHHSFKEPKQQNSMQILQQQQKQTESKSSPDRSIQNQYQSSEMENNNSNHEIVHPPQPFSLPANHLIINNNKVNPLDHKIMQKGVIKIGNGINNSGDKSQSRYSTNQRPSLPSALLFSKSKRSSLAGKNIQFDPSDSSNNPPAGSDVSSMSRQPSPSIPQRDSLTNHILPKHQQQIVHSSSLQVDINQSSLVVASKHSSIIQPQNSLYKCSIQPACSSLQSSKPLNNSICVSSLHPQQQQQQQQEQKQSQPLQVHHQQLSSLMQHHLQQNQQQHQQDNNNHNQQSDSPGKYFIKQKPIQPTLSQQPNSNVSLHSANVANSFSAQQITKPLKKPLPSSRESSPYMKIPSSRQLSAFLSPYMPRSFSLKRHSAVNTSRTTSQSVLAPQQRIRQRSKPSLYDPEINLSRRQSLGQQIAVVRSQLTNENVNPAKEHVQIGSNQLKEAVLSARPTMLSAKQIRKNSPIRVDPHSFRM